MKLPQRSARRPTSNPTSHSVEVTVVLTCFRSTTVSSTSHASRSSAPLRGGAAAAAAGPHGRSTQRKSPTGSRLEHAGTPAAPSRFTKVAERST